MVFLFPISHENQLVQRLPYITISIIVLNVLFFLFSEPLTRSKQKIYVEKIEEVVAFYDKHTDIKFEDIVQDFDSPESSFLNKALKKKSSNNSVRSTQSDKERLIELLKEAKGIRESMPFYKYGLIPSNPKLFNIVSSLFIHDGFFHLFFNMIFLWIAGCSIEDRWGRPLYLGFYLLSGILASYAHILMFPKSIIPLVGASGAIAGTMGAFLILLYKTRIRVIYVIWLFLFYFKAGSFYIPAYVALPFWVLEQLYYAILTPHVAEGGGVAFWAHIGGFVFGALFAILIKLSKLEEKYIQPKIEDEISINQHPKLVSAMEKIDQERYDGAISDINKVLLEDARHPDANLLLIQIYKKKNKTEEAARIEKELVSFYLAEKNNDRALDTYSDMINLSHLMVLSARDQMKIASLLERNGSLMEAAEAYEKLVYSYPNTYETLKAAFNAGLIFLDELDQPERALEIFNKVKDLCNIYPEWEEKIEDGLKRAAYKIDNR